MEEDWGDDVFGEGREEDDGGHPDAENCVRLPGIPRRGRAAKAKAKGKQPRQGKATPGRSEKKCFVTKCTRNKAGNSKWCCDHKRTTDAMVYQAKRDEQVDTLSKVLNDEVEAEKAIEDFETASPPGKFRKHAIDWVSFMKKHGVRRSFMKDENEELMSWGDYRKFCEQKDKNEAWAKCEWERMRGRPQEFEQEGEGPTMKIWVPTRITRKRRHEQFIEDDVSEGSRQLKGMKKEDKDKLVSHLAGIAPAFGEKFFQQINNIAKGEQLPPEPEQIEQVDKNKDKEKKIDVAIVAPREAQKQEKKLDNVAAALSKATQAGEAALAKDKDNEDLGDKLMSSYRLALSSRLLVARALVSETMADVLALKASAVVNGGSSVAVAKISAGADAADPAKEPGQEGNDATETSGPTDAEKTEDAKTAPAENQERQDLPGEVKEAPQEPAATPAATDDKQDGVAVVTPAGDEIAKEVAPASSKSSVSGVSKKLHEKLSAAVVDIIRLGGQRAAMVHDDKLICCWPQLVAMPEQMMNSQSVKELDEMVQKFVDGLECVKMIATGVTKTAKTLESHIDNKKRAIARSAVKEEEDKMRLAANALKAQAKSAAKRIAAAAEEHDSVFNVDFHTHVNQASLKNMTEIVDLATAADEHTPLLFKNPSAVMTLLEEAAVQATLGAYGGSYSKTQVLKNEGRCAQPLYAMEGKDKVDAMFNIFTQFFGDKNQPDFEKLPPSLSPPFKNTWLFGFSPKMTDVNFTPYCMASLRCLVAFQVTCVVFDVKALASALGQIKQCDKLKISDVLEYLKNMTDANVAELASKGCVGVVCEQKAKDVLYIPAGHVVIEKASEGMLLYGFRKAWMNIGDAAHQSYEAMIGCWREEGRQTQRMEEILPFLMKDDESMT